MAELMGVWARMVALSPHEWINVALCVAGALVAFGAIARMTADGTPHTIKIAFVTVGAGLIGETLAYFMPARWELPFDTVMYGGILALIVGTRRHTVWLQPRWMPAISAWTSVLTWVLFFGTVKG